MAAQELFSTPLYNSVNLQDYYRLEGNSTDTKGAHNGTDTGMTYSTGKFGQGAVFAGGSGHYIDPGNIYSGSGDFTLCGWIKTSTTGVRQTILTQGAGSTNNAFFARVDTTNKLNFELYSGANVSGVTTVTDGVFHHFAFVNTSKTMIVYCDGVTDNGAGTSIASINISASTSFSYIGAEGNSGQNPLTGTLDDIAFFTRALTATEVKNLYNGFPGGGFMFAFL